MNVRRLISAAYKLRLPVSTGEIRKLIATPISFLVLGDDDKFYVTATPLEDDAVYGKLVWHTVEGFDAKG